MGQQPGTRVTDPVPSHQGAVGDLATIRAEAVERVRSFEKLARRTVREAWYAGQALQRVKDTSVHGAWMPWLKSEGVSLDMQKRCRAIYAGHQIGDLRQFASVAAALRALPKPEPKSEPDLPTDKPAELTPAEKRLVERDKLVEQAKAAEERAQAAEQAGREAHQMAEHFEAEAKVAGGFQRGRDVIEERQAEIRQLKHRIYELEAENGELKRENHGLRRVVKELRAELDAAMQPADAGDGLPF